MKRELILVEVFVILIILGALLSHLEIYGGSTILVENGFKAGDQITFSCPSSDLYLVNVTKGKSYKLKLSQGSQNLRCLFVRKLDVNFWDCKGVIELQLTCRTGPVECETQKPIRSLRFSEMGVFVNDEGMFHTKWAPRFSGYYADGALDRYQGAIEPAQRIS